MTRPLSVIAEAKKCMVCEDVLPLPPRPLLQGTEHSRILIIGQAPGVKAHEAGVPWLDKSGERLRDWLGVTDQQFYNADLFALIPMGFCYPGKKGTVDAPPRPECAPKWHPPILKALTNVGLTVFLGQYAVSSYYKNTYRNITEAVRDYRKLLRRNRIVLPHPSPRNNIWVKKNPWFINNTIPALKQRIALLL